MAQRPATAANAVPEKSINPKNDYNININYELGMHCTGFDFSVCCVLSPYNSVQAQVVKNSTRATQTPRLLEADPKDPTVLEDKKNRFKLAYGYVGNNDSEGGNPEGTSADAKKLFIGEQIKIPRDSGPSGAPMFGGFLTYSGNKSGTDFLENYDMKSGGTSNRIGRDPVLCQKCHVDNVIGVLNSRTVGDVLGDKAKPEDKNRPIVPLTEAMHSVHLLKQPMPDSEGRTASCQGCHPAHRQAAQYNPDGSHGPLKCSACHVSNENGVPFVVNKEKHVWNGKPMLGDYDAALPWAASASASDQVLVLVGERPITMTDLETAVGSSTFSVQFPSMDPKDQAALRGDMLKRLVAGQLLLLEAERRGLDSDPTYQADADAYQRGILYRAYMDKLRADIRIPEDKLAQLRDTLKNQPDALEPAQSAYISAEYRVLRALAMETLKTRSHLVVHDDRLYIGAAPDTVLAQPDGFSLKLSDIQGDTALKTEDDMQLLRERLFSTVELELVVRTAQADALDVSAIMAAFRSEKLPALLIDRLETSGSRTIFCTPISRNTPASVMCPKCATWRKSSSPPPQKQRPCAPALLQVRASTFLPGNIPSTPLAAWGVQ